MLAKTYFFAGLAAENLKNYEKATIYLKDYENILTEFEKNYFSAQQADNFIDEK